MSERVKTLVIVSPGFPENEADSTCLSHLQIFVKTLKESNPALNIVVLALDYPFSSNEYQWHGLRIIPFGRKNSSLLFRVFARLRIWALLRELNNNYQVIGLLSFWLGKCAFIADSFGKKYGLRHYCWVLGQDARPGNKYVNKINPAVGSLMAVSDFVAGNLNKNYGVLPRHIIPIGINASLYNAVHVSRDIDVLGVGSLIPLKQYPVFLEIIRDLKHFFPGIKAVICGDGPDMEQLRALVNAMGLENNISLTGELPHSKILALMQQSKIFLHPSNYEGFSTVCLEALYAGNQVVSFIRPMSSDIENWHIAIDKNHMLQLVKDMLQSSVVKYQLVLPYSVQDSAAAVIGLFDQQTKLFAESYKS